MPLDMHTDMLPECAGKFGSIETEQISNKECLVRMDGKLDKLDAKVDGKFAGLDAKLDTLRSRPTWFVSILLGAFLSLLTAFIVFAATQHP